MMTSYRVIQSVFYIANILNTNVNVSNVILILEIKCLYCIAHYFEKKKNRSVGFILTQQSKYQHEVFFIYL